MLWPVIPLASLATNGAAGCSERQVFTPSRSYRLTLNKLFLNSGRRPTADLQKVLLNGDFVLKPDIHIQVAIGTAHTLSRR